MKKFIFQTMLLGGALMASCSDNIYDAPVHEEYSKSFVELFGPVHPDQDWNMAAQKSVTVNPGSANEVKIYADNGNGYQLAGHFTNVSGTQTFKFDALEKADKFIVVVGSMSKEVENGGTVDFSATSRSYLNGNYMINDTTNLYTKLEDYRIFSKDYLVQYLEKQPEGKDARETEGLNINFTAIAGAQPVTVYPVYWNAGFYHEFGIHTYDENDILHVYINGLFADENYDWLLDTRQDPPELHPNASTSGTVIDIVVLKSKIGDPPSSSGSSISQKNITERASSSTTTSAQGEVQS